jgi:hypothetical protein
MTDVRIVADDGDSDEPDEFDQNPQLRATPPAPRQRQQPPAPEPAADDDRPSYEDLMTEVVNLRERTRKNNGELAKRRHVQQWMDQHGIDDLDSWLSSLGVDKDTGQRAPAAPAPATNPDQGEIDRLIALETEKHQAALEERQSEWEAQRGKLSEFVRRAAVEAALTRAGFTGTPDAALRVVDLNLVQVVEDGDGYKIEGANEAVASLQDEIPAWFRPRNGRPRTGGEDVDGGRRPKPPPRKPTWEEQALGRLTGQRGSG